MFYTHAQKMLLVEIVDNFIKHYNKKAQEESLFKIHISTAEHGVNLIFRHTISEEDCFSLLNEHFLKQYRTSHGSEYILRDLFQKFTLNRTILNDQNNEYQEYFLSQQLLVKEAITYFANEIKIHLKPSEKYNCNQEKNTSFLFDALHSIITPFFSCGIAITDFKSFDTLCNLSLINLEEYLNTFTDNILLSSLVSSQLSSSIGLQKTWIENLFYVSFIPNSGNKFTERYFQHIDSTFTLLQTKKSYLSPEILQSMISATSIEDFNLHFSSYQLMIEQNNKAEKNHTCTSIYSDDIKWKNQLLISVDNFNVFNPYFQSKIKTIMDKHFISFNFTNDYFIEHNNQIMFLYKPHDNQYCSEYNLLIYQYFHKFLKNNNVFKLYDFKIQDLKLQNFGMIINTDADVNSQPHIIFALNNLYKNMCSLFQSYLIKEYKKHADNDRLISKIHNHGIYDQFLNDSELQNNMEQKFREFYLDSKLNQETSANNQPSRKLERKKI